MSSFSDKLQSYAQGGEGCQHPIKDVIDLPDGSEKCQACGKVFPKSGANPPTTAPVPGIDKSRIDWCIDNVALNEPAFKLLADEARAEVKATFDSHASLAARVAELEAALHELLQIAQLAEYYSPGELAEFPDRVRKAIETGEALLGGAS